MGVLRSKEYCRLLGFLDKRIYFSFFNAKDHRNPSRLLVIIKVSSEFTQTSVEFRDHSLQYLDLEIALRLPVG